MKYILAELAGLPLLSPQANLDDLPDDQEDEYDEDAEDDDDDNEVAEPEMTKAQPVSRYSTHVGIST
jgi:hypothetical protein